VIEQPKDIVERVERVLEYHRVSKHTPESVSALKPQTDPAAQPATVQTFPGLPKIPLPTELLDLPLAARAILRNGLKAHPDNSTKPPQDLQTLATWLYMSYGVTSERKFEGHPYSLRTCPSGSALYPAEIYVAAFAITGLEPGLYSFNPREFCLTPLRGGDETLALIKRGRPDLTFLRNVPAVLLVSTIFWRSAWKYRVRGFRIALLDAGHLVGNLVAVANGLGIGTATRLKLNDNMLRELLGNPIDADFGLLEAVQAMVAWSDVAAAPMKSKPAGSGEFQGLPAIERAPLSREVVPYGSIASVHHDCVAPGVPLRDLRPPLTELSPMPVVHHSQPMGFFEDVYDGPSLRRVLLSRRSSRDFEPTGISRDAFLSINSTAFRTGTFAPLLPDGPHTALIRPFWIVHAVTGMWSGIWYYHPHTDRWVMLRHGGFRERSRMMCIGQSRCGSAAAVCVMTANLQATLYGTGPDIYRLAHLEAGIVGQRIALAAASHGLGSCGTGTYYDQGIRSFLGIDDTGWEVIYACTIGVQAADSGPASYPGLGVG
jgi:SagB-type dehydrogenase family enzyme